jgi:DNA-binding PadR family transcriptional regulator
LYHLTDKGRNAVRRAFDTFVSPLPSSVDWRRYCWVVRAKIRRKTLLGLGSLVERKGHSVTTTELRRYLRNDHPVDLTCVAHALRELKHLGLVRVDGVTKHGWRKLYRLTPSGNRIRLQLLR